MAIFNNGANGAFSGKVGSIVGSNWRKVNYIRGVSKLTEKPASEKQKMQRKRFQVAVSFLEQIKDVLNEGFGKLDTSRLTGYNLAVQHTLLNAITGKYPDFSIDYSKVLISKGSLYGTALVKASSMTPSTITIEWQCTPNKFNSFAGDQVNVVIYNATRNLFIFDSSAHRQDEKVAVEVPLEFSNDCCHVYLFFKSEEKGRLSTSIYTGPVIVY